MNKQNKNYERSQCKLRGLVRNIAGAQKSLFTVPEVRAGMKEVQEAVGINHYMKLKKLHTFADKQKKAHKCEGTFIYFDGNAVFADSRICTAEGGAHSVG